MSRHRGDPDALSPSELRVLQLLMAGRTNQEIATARGCDIRTVKAHLSNVYSKIDAHSRLEAVLWAQRRGLTPDEAKETA